MDIGPPCISISSAGVALRREPDNSSHVSDKAQNRVFPKVDHSGRDARIVLEQNKFSKKATSTRLKLLPL